MPELREEADGMIQFLIGAVAGCFVGITATVINYAANDRTASACAEAYERGKRDGWRQTCMRLKTDCPAYERFIERGD